MSTSTTFSERYLWRSVLELYNQEKLKGAHDLAEEIGLGDLGGFLQWFRILEAEYLTSESSVIREPSPGLSIEFPDAIEEQTQNTVEKLFLREIDVVGQRLAISDRPPTRITVLVQEVDAPWATSPYGYCIQKVPFTKICLPYHLLSNSGRMAEAVRHEYAHVLTLNLGKGWVPRWLSEAISTLMETETNRQDRISPPAAWFSPSDLDAIYRSEAMPVGKRWVDRVMGPDWSSGDADPSRQRNSVNFAYNQSSIIGKFLRAKGGEGKVGALLTAIGDDSPWSSIQRVLLGRNPVDIALKKVFGLSRSQLFEAVRAWL